MPSLTVADRRAFRLGQPAPQPCTRCRERVLRGYCRQCDEFYVYGCRCPHPHAGHRTYEGFEEGGEWGNEWPNTSR